MDNLSEQIKAEAKRLGFSFLGITQPKQTAHFSHYLKWIAEGKNAGLDYLAMDYVAKGRGDPASLLPDTRSVLVGGIHYQPRITLSEISEGKESRNGWVAAYGTLPDYHKSLKHMFLGLTKSIRELTNHDVKSKLFVDSGPVMEKDFAMQAGLGWIGKNSLLMTPEFGSCCLIGCLFTDIELSSDEPFGQDGCGDCAACISACPTGCINLDRTIDASRCISYLTVETQGDFPEDLSKKTNGWVFGCDICQMVCPMNKKAIAVNPDFSSSAAKPIISQRIVLSEEFRIDFENFDRKFKSTPVHRIGHLRYLRNITNALTNKTNTRVK